MFDPLTGQHHRVASLPVKNMDDSHRWNAAMVLCTDAEDGHVDGDCFYEGYMQAFICLCESVSGVWGNVVSTATTTV